MLDLNDNFNDWPLVLVNLDGKKEWVEATDEEVEAMQRANEQFFDLRFESMAECA